MKQPNSKTFCVAPWFQIRNENDMHKRVCCAIKSYATESENQTPVDFLNSPSNIELKKNLHNGIKTKECIACWKNEDSDIKSLRQRLNSILTKNSPTIANTWLHSYFSQKNDFLSDDVFMADIKIGNTCNFACVMCIPDDSSLIYNEWTKNKNTFFIKEKLAQDPNYLDRVKKQRKEIESLIKKHVIKSSS